MGTIVMDDDALVQRLRDGDPVAAQAIVQRHNRMLWRIARGIVRDDSEAEEVVQDAYVRALTAIDGFRGHSSLATWLSRIVVNEALRRRERARCHLDLDEVAETDASASVTMPAAPGPDCVAATHEVRRIVERAIDALPAPFRVVFMMRIVEQMSVEETASGLGIPPATVKTRLHRANLYMRASLGAELAALLDGAFPFGGARCDRLTRAVLARLPLRTLH